jgi:hypothetical protein
MSTGDSKGETKKWHLSVWILPLLIAVILLATGLIASLSGFEMRTLIVVIVVAGLLVEVLVWVGISPVALKRKIVLSIITVVAAVPAIWWVVSYDRPVLNPEIGGLITQQDSGDFALDVEALVRNTGRLSSYADNWRLRIKSGDLALEGSQLFGQKRPEGAVDEPELFDQEFPVGKPVRGWLYFTFRGATFDQLRSLFSCAAAPSDATVTLSLADTRERHEWAQTRSLSELIREHCQVISQVASPPPSPLESAPRPKGGRPAKTAPQPQPGTVINAPNGIGISGGTVTNPTVINTQPPPPPFDWEAAQIEAQPNPLEAARGVPLTPEVRQKYMEWLMEDAGHPGVVVDIVLKGTFYNPAFFATCNVGCRASQYCLLVSGRVVCRGLSTAGPVPSADSLQVEVPFDVNRWSGGTHLRITFRSLDDRALHIISFSTSRPS